MKIFDFINKLKSQTDVKKIIRRNGTILINPGRVPKAQHMLFQGLSDNFILEYLVKSYKYKIPKQYIEFLKYSNGMDIFMYKIKTSKSEFAGSNLTIYGIPKTKPFNRPIDMEEPFDIRIEDLRRHSNVPETWLKIGGYQLLYEFDGEADLYIDCKTERVYSTKIDDYVIINNWDTLDDCLCYLFQRAQNAPLECIYSR